MPLARYFLQKAAGGARQAPTLADDALVVLTSHRWPGNVRELQNLLQRAVILCSGNVIRARDLRFELPVSSAAAPVLAVTPAEPLLQENLHAVEGHLIVDVLNRVGSRQRAAELLGVSPRTLRYKIARLRSVGIAIPRSRDTAGAPL